MRSLFRNIMVTVLLALAATLGAPQALSASAWTTLAWDLPARNTDGSPLTNLAGYKVYYGTESGNYAQYVDVGNMTSTTVAELEWNSDYFYAVKAYNGSGVESDFSEELVWRTPELPSIVQQPQSTTVRIQSSASFIVSASGTGPLYYTWRRDGQPLPLVNYPDCVVRICTEDHDGAQYDVVVSSPYGSVTSQVAVLTVLPPTGWMSNGSYDWFEVDPVTSVVSSFPAKADPSVESLTGELTVSFFTKSDRYVVWTRLFDDGTSGAFLVSMDGGPEELWHVSGGLAVESTGSHEWDVVSRKATRSTGINPKDAWVFQLSEGMHTLRIREYVPGSLIDLVLITSDLAWTPGTSLTADDGDGDGLPDTWEKLHFGGSNATSGSADTDGDGVSNLDEFLAGSSAVDPQSMSLVGVYSVDKRPTVVFEALEATGPGYDGLRRYYGLEACTDLRTGIWQPVPGYEAILGCGQTVQFDAGGTDAPGTCYRTTMWLE